MLYRLHRGSYSPVLRRTAAALLTLIITIGIPTSASLLHQYVEGPSGPIVIQNGQQNAEENEGTPEKETEPAPDDRNQDQQTETAQPPLPRDTDSTAVPDEEAEPLDSAPSPLVGGRGGGSPDSERVTDNGGAIQQEAPATAPQPSEQTGK